MSQYNNFYTFLILLFGGSLSAQDCNFNLKAYILDTDTKEPLELVNVFIQELGTGEVTDEKGYFEISGLCKQEYHLTLSHIGCSSQLIHLYVEGDTSIQFFLSHNANLLDEVMISAYNETSSTKISKKINEQYISDNTNKNLSNLLDGVLGVSMLSNGSGVAKPVVQGLFGNRLSILNNGIAQSGQQWGNDHSPEIDPLVADKIEVIKGSEVLAYMGSNLGNIISVVPQSIGRSPHLHGKVNYTFESNGLGNSGNLQLQKYHPNLAWKVNATYKKSGDNKTPNYFLNNTGSIEKNIAIQLEKALSDKWFAKAYLSSFNTELGILRGSHISSVDNLKAAFGRATPFFTEDDFSYDIDAPKQSVNHHLLKVEVKKIIDDHKTLTLTGATQFNLRREFDIRRSGRTDIPALNLKQLSYFLESKYHSEIDHVWNIDIGIQHNTIDNTNNPETGILPLIPDYLSFNTGLFAIVKRELGKSILDFGIRNDLNIQNVVAISNSLERDIIRYNRTFNNLSLSGGWRYNASEAIQLIYHTAYHERNPGINELYSNGLHQGVSGIEEGDVNLKNEEAFINDINLRILPSKNLNFELSIYSQNVQDYIFLNPQDEFRPTIRGSFPVYKYEQTKAHIYGLDASTYIQFHPSLSANLQYSYIKGKDIDNDIALVNIPSNSIKASIEYKAQKPLVLGSQKVENISVECANNYVFRQSQITDDQDFLPTPDAYFLMGLKVAGEIQFSATRLRIVLNAENLLNATYRNYLNRQRYFANDLGRNISGGLSFSF